MTDTPTAARRALAMVGVGLVGIGGALAAVTAGTTFLIRRQRRRERRDNNWEHRVEADYRRDQMDIFNRRVLAKQPVPIDFEAQRKQRALLANPGIVVHDGLSVEFVRDRFQIYQCEDGNLATILLPGEPLVLDAGCHLFIKGRFAICCDVIVKPGAQLGFEQLYRVRTFNAKTLDPASYDLFAGNVATWKRGQVVENNTYIDANACPAFETAPDPSTRRCGTCPNTKYLCMPTFSNACACNYSTLVEGGLVITHWRPEDAQVQSWVRDSHALLRPVMKASAGASLSSATTTETGRSNGTGAAVDAVATRQQLSPVVEATSDEEQGEVSDTATDNISNNVSSTDDATEFDATETDDATEFDATETDASTTTEDDAESEDGENKANNRTQRRPTTPQTPETPHEPGSTVGVNAADGVPALIGVSVDNNIAGVDNDDITALMSGE